MDTLPQELLENIFNFVPPSKYFGQYGNVCRRWKTYWTRRDWEFLSVRSTRLRYFQRRILPYRWDRNKNPRDYIQGFKLLIVTKANLPSKLGKRTRWGALQEHCFDSSYPNAIVRLFDLIKSWEEDGWGNAISLTVQNVPAKDWCTGPRYSQQTFDSWLGRPPPLQGLKELRSVRNVVIGIHAGFGFVPLDMFYRVVQHLPLAIRVDIEFPCLVGTENDNAVSAQCRLSILNHFWPYLGTVEELFSLEIQNSPASINALLMRSTSRLKYLAVWYIHASTWMEHKGRECWKNLQYFHEQREGELVNGKLKDPWFVPYNIEEDLISCKPQRGWSLYVDIVDKTTDLPYTNPPVTWGKVVVLAENVDPAGVDSDRSWIERPRCYTFLPQTRSDTFIPQPSSVNFEYQYRETPADKPWLGICHRLYWESLPELPFRQMLRYLAENPEKTPVWVGREHQDWSSDHQPPMLHILLQTKACITGAYFLK